MARRTMMLSAKTARRVPRSLPGPGKAKDTQGARVKSRLHTPRSSALPTAILR